MKEQNKRETAWEGLVRPAPAALPSRRHRPSDPRLEQTCLCARRQHALGGPEFPRTGCRDLDVLFSSFFRSCSASSTLDAGWKACPRAMGRLWLSAADLLSIAHRRSQSGRVWATLANISPEHTPSLPESRIRLPQTERDCWRIAGARPEMRPIDRGAGRRRKPASHLATFRANQMSGRTSSKRGRPSAAVLTLIHFPFSLSH